MAEVNFGASVETENIQIEFLTNPLRYQPADGKLISAVEAKFMFTDSFWQKKKKDAPAAGICVNHARALNKGFNTGEEDESPNKTEWIVVLEEDVTPEDDAAKLGMATLLANFYENRDMADALLVGLTWSQHLPNIQAK